MSSVNWMIEISTLEHKLWLSPSQIVSSAGNDRTKWVIKSDLAFISCFFSHKFRRCFSNDFVSCFFNSLLQFTSSLLCCSRTPAWIHVYCLRVNHTAHKQTHPYYCDTNENNTRQYTVMFKWGSVFSKQPKRTVSFVVFGYFLRFLLIKLFKSLCCAIRIISMAYW